VVEEAALDFLFSFVLCFYTRGTLSEDIRLIIYVDKKRLNFSVTFCFVIAFRDGFACVKL